jgi:lysozyme
MLSKLKKMLSMLKGKLKKILSMLKSKLKKIPKPVLICCGAVMAALLIGFGVYQSVHMFSPTVIKGIDISHFQGDISWRAVAESGDVKFVYMKATEGKAYVDPNFTKNWKGAATNGITSGAYHYYSLSSTGAEQASNFIATVPKQKGKLPPAIDIETSVTSQADFNAELATFVQMVTNHYGQKPVFYVPDKVYNIIYDDYIGFDFWIIEFNAQPTVKGFRFWQYSNKGTVASIEGKVDLDKYQGSLWNFNGMLSK